MPTVVENATTGLVEARESLRIAEQDLRNWKTTNQPLDPTHTTYVELKAEVTACRTVLAGAQQTLQQALAAQSRDIEQETVKQPTETNEQINSNVPELEQSRDIEQETVQQPTETKEQINSNVPELEASRPNMPSLNSLAIILSRPPFWKLFKFNTVPSTDALMVPLKPIIIFTLFWRAMLNFNDFHYTLRLESLFFLAVSCVGIFAVMTRQATFLSHFCWAQLSIDIIEFIYDFNGVFMYLEFGANLPDLIIPMVLLIIMKCFLKAFFFYCVIKYWDSIREGYVTLDETTPFFGPNSTE